MRRLGRYIGWTLLVLAVAQAWGQSPSSENHPGSPSAQPSPGFSSSKPQPATEPYCDQELGFCITLSEGWKLVEVVYDGHGVTFAPEQKGDQSLWAQLSVAETELPAQEGKDPITLEDLVTALVGRMASQTGTMRTVRRSETTVASHMAQSLEVRYDDSGHQWAEIITVVDAGEGEFYSLAFKSLADQRDRYVASLDEMLHTFRLIE